MDRICLSVAMLPIAREMGWSAGIQGLVQSAFLWGYMATQLVGGTLADKYGGKLVMAAGVAWFSLASMLLPAAALTPWTAAAGLALPAVLVARFLVGFGEGVALPSMNNLVARLVDPARKATALGASFSGFHAGNLLGLLASPLILQRLGWRWLFYIYGVLGAPLLLLWLATVPDAPPRRAQQPQQQEQQQGQQPGPPSGAASGGGGGVTVATLLSKRATWAIIVANFVNHWGYFIYLSWMPTYFYQVLGLDLRASSFLSFIPWVVMAAGSSAAGLLADALVGAGVDVTRRGMGTAVGGMLQEVRKGVQTVAFLGPVLALVLLSNHSISPAAAVACMAAALGITSLGQAGFVANISDVAPRHAGLLFGLCNTFGCLAGILGVSVCGFVLERTGSFAPIFQATAVLYVLGTAVWNAACTAEPQF
eukprot:scaffold5.g660.t1